MSEKPRLGKVLVNRRAKPPHHFSSSNHKLQSQVVIPRSPRKPLKCFKRCNSDPTFSSVGSSMDVDVTDEDHDGTVSLRQACADVLSSSPELALPYSPSRADQIRHYQTYNKDSRVVVNVTVEGSPGPVRLMIKLGSSVEETMKIVKKQYNSEGRSPQLDPHSISTFELHHSYFSLQCLDTSDMIGDIGRRSFYMRRCRCNDENSLIVSEVISTSISNSPPSNTLILFLNSISHIFRKIIKLTAKIWKILGCVDR